MLGTDQCLDGSHYIHSTLPMVFAWVKSQPASAYKHLMRAYQKRLVTYYDATDELNVIGGIWDHSDDTAYGFYQLLNS